jgi:hypothetical protein
MRAHGGWYGVGSPPRRVHTPPDRQFGGESCGCHFRSSRLLRGRPSGELGQVIGLASIGGVNAGAAGRHHILPPLRAGAS